MHLAIDIGGTKTLLALFSSTGRITKRLKFQTSNDPDVFIKALTRHLNSFFPARALRTPSLKNVVIAIAGPVDPIFSSSNHPLVETLPTTYGKPLKYGNLNWHGFKFSEQMELCIKNLFKSGRVQFSSSAPRLPVFDCCPIYIQNDANLATFYECRNLKGKSVYLTYSTGIGGGIMMDGVLSDASYGFEPGHTKYIWGGRRLEYEDIASAAAIKDAYGVRATEVTGRAAYQDIALRISTGLTDIIRDHQPDTIVIGGALGVRLRYYKKYLTPVLAASLHCPQSDLPEIIPAEFPFDSVIYGCYLYGRIRD